MQRSHDNASPDDLDIVSLGRSVTGSLKGIALATALAGGVSFLVLSLMTPKYTSEATIEIVNEDPSLPRGTTATGELSRPDLDTVRTQARALQSRDLAAQVAAELKLAATPEFSRSADEGPLGAVTSALGLGAPANETLEQRVLGRYYKSLQITPFKESRVIGIEAKSADPVLAADIANTLVKVYREDLLTRRVATDREPTPGLEKEIRKLEADIQSLESDIERERSKLREVRISSPSGSSENTLNTQQLQELNTKLNDAKSQRSEAEARARIIRDMLQSSGQVDASPDVLKSPVIQQLQVQRARIDRQLAELSATLLPAHPRMQQMKAEQGGFQKQMRDEAQKIVLSLENEAKIAGARENGVKAELDRMVQKRSDVSQDTSRLRQLDADLTGKREILSGYKKRQDDARVRSGGKIAPITVRLIQQATPSSEPVSPKKAYAFLVMAATGLGGLAFSIARGVLAGTRGGVASAQVPFGGHGGNGQGGGSGQGGGGNGGGGGRRVSARESEPSPLAAAAGAAGAARVGGMTQPARGRANISGDLDDICQRLLERANDQPGYRTLMTAEEDGLDAAAQALDLARRIVAAGKRCVLVDWSVAAKPISAELAIPRTPGIRELIANEVPFESALHVIDEAGLHVIAAGKPRTASESPQEIEGIHLVLEALDESYDHVLVTAEPAEARRLFGLVDGAFDAGLLMARPSALGEPDRVEPGFLGFAAPEMDVIRFVEQSAPAVATSRLRAMRGAASAPAH